MSYKGKRVIVTGAGGGLGKAIVARLYKEEATIFALDKDEESLSKLKELFPNINSVNINLLSWDDTRKAVTKIVEEQPVEHLINNAGLVIPETFLETTQENIDVSFGLHFKAVFNISQVVAKAMIANRIHGSIVNVSSITSLRASEKLGIYCSSKASLDALTKVMACELGEQKIRVNSVNPTAIMSKMALRLPHNDNFMRRTPMKRIAELDEVVNAIMFLLGDECPMMNGSFLTIDGGYSVCAN